MSIPFQTCEALPGCERDAWFLCPRCLRWLCREHEPAGWHGCATSIDEQLRVQRAEFSTLDRPRMMPGVDETEGDS